MSRLVVLALALAVLGTAASGRVLHQAGLTSEAANATQPAATPTATYTTFQEALQAANTTANLTTLVAAVEAAGVANAINDTTAWTILAPTNEAFDTRLAALNLTTQQLLDPANRPLLIQILSFHVIPAGAVMSSNLTDGMNVSTALANDGNLTVHLMGGNVTFIGPVNNATVVVPDIMAGSSVIHVINDVLVPPMNATANATGPASALPGAGAANMTGGGESTGMMQSPLPVEPMASPPAGTGGNTTTP